MLPTFIPSPARGVWYLGPVPIRAYAMFILLGIVVATWWTRRRWVAMGRDPDQVFDIVLWAVPFGIVGGRLYHLITDPELYFAPGRQPIRALYIWDGGLGIWGAVALGAVGAWIACRKLGVPLTDFADAAAPGLVLAQAIGRWGNYFNQELFGKPTTLPWALQIDPAHRPADTPNIGLYQPTFLYESLWDIGVAVLLVWAGRRFGLRNGRLFALYVAAYTVGPGLGRGAARGPRQPLPRAAPERLDQPGRVPRRGRVPPGAPFARPGAGRRDRRGDDRRPLSRRRSASRRSPNSRPAPRCGLGGE